MEKLLVDNEDENGKNEDGSKKSIAKVWHLIILLFLKTVIYRNTFTSYTYFLYWYSTTCMHQALLMKCHMAQS